MVRGRCREHARPDPPAPRDDELRNPKCEIRRKPEARSSKPDQRFRATDSGFRICFEIRNSEFGFFVQMTAPTPKAELMRSLGRLVRGLAALFWGLPLATLVCAHNIVSDWVLSFGFAGPLLLTGILHHGGRQLGYFQPQERIWIQAVERAKILALINFGLAPFIYWWNRVPEESFFAAATGLFFLTALLFVHNLNLALERQVQVVDEQQGCEKEQAGGGGKEGFLGNSVPPVDKRREAKVDEGENFCAFHCLYPNAFLWLEITELADSVIEDSGEKQWAGEGEGSHPGGEEVVGADERGKRQSPEQCRQAAPQPAEGAHQLGFGGGGGHLHEKAEFRIPNFETNPKSRARSSKPLFSS